ncbi:diguanylate cyclase (GGDEF)-like protein [Actinoplanes lutulentus]|uniref:Diguanylate cyclase (GGDEF)-like protein n=1 Tax=Actinoplanes lutulentus TaxID=1287878 RepID=A0A327YZN7_9ACTN|nr:bifunctional diguanylate cyclase/phosphodiesterase [Actinoplanes lutulentus]MBB2943075.1 diguanylate cyclase (GGDEF)-like protein [Actinoplanes lutulentus]RAK26659.1 diguanylate cyclase (GGDEF)-like protein [Actinoplanes lutulentus]
MHLWSRRPFDLPFVASLGLFVFVLAWFAIGLAHVWPHPIIGWLPLPVLSALTTYQCWLTARSPALDDTTRRFWGQLGIACGLLVFGSISNIADAFGGPVISQALSIRTQLIFVAAVLVVLVALLRLPTWQRTSGDWIRFGLDTGIVALTGTVLLWHFSISRIDFATSTDTSPRSVLVIMLVAVVALITFVKVAFAGAGRLDRGALHILSAGVGLSASTGVLTPLIADKPHLAASLIAFPMSQLTATLAARRQRHNGPARETSRPDPRRFSLVPYLSVAILYGVLLKVELPRGGAEAMMACSVTGLTLLVVLRQITTLRDNSRLLDTVDTNLEQLRAYQKQLDHQVTHDSLTGINNRSAWADEISRRLAGGEPFVVALLDLDDFKVINDRYGHHTGDVLLQTISRRLRERLRPEDTVARLGGDEFTLLLPGLDDEGTEELLRALLAEVQCPVMVEGHDLAPRISVGVTASRPEDTAGEVLRRADVAMYAAKREGGGRWTWFDTVMDQLADSDARLGADLRQAILRDQLFLVYQPIVELPHGRLAGVEALVRWRHPEHGLIPPGIFIPLAERNGQIVELGRWIVEQAVHQTARWVREYGADAPEKVSVNVSARQLNEPGFPAEMAALLSAAGLDPERLVVEVTETAVLGTGIALDAVRALHDLGLRIALDDFGTGQSSLSLLVECPVTWLKVDKSFVDGVTTASPQAVIVDGLIGITRGLRMQAVAEGVETAEQAARLYQAGYRFAQGYHFARPMPHSDVELLFGGIRPDNSLLEIARR